jgi:peptidoglycan/xylan/chitin deacetylase (PgdA/CDA1 family)
VALTFDDGYYDFYKVALPILKEFNLPATLYLTTSYVYYNLPCFDAICSYVLWKGRNTTLDLGEIIGEDEKFDLSIDAARVAAYDRLIGFAWKRKLSEEEKNALAIELSRRLKIDYDALCAKRILHLLNPVEVRNLAAEGIDVQLHTHNHRSPLNRRLFSKEIEDNRNSIREMTGSWATHFCYPKGNFTDELISWLEEMKIRTATTCDPGLANHNSNPLLLPRLVDTTLLSPVEFEGWLAGVSAALPRRRRTYNLGISEQEIGVAIGASE